MKWAVLEMQKRIAIHQRINTLLKGNHNENCNDSHSDSMKLWFESKLAS